MEVTQCNVRLKMLIFQKTSTEIGLRVLTMLLQQMLNNNDPIPNYQVLNADPHFYMTFIKIMLIQGNTHTACAHTTNIESLL